MVAPVLAGFTSNNTGGDPVMSIVLTKPANVAVDDLLIIIAGNDNGFDNDAWAAITGWTKIYGVASSTFDASFAVYWRVADGTEGATQTVEHGNTNEMYGWYLRITGADTTTPIDVLGTSSGSSSNSFPISGVTTTQDDALAFYVLAFDGGDGFPFSVSGTGWTEQGEEQSGSAGSDASGTFGTKVQSTAGATGTATVSSSATDGAVYVQFAVAPAAAAGTDLDATLFTETDSFGASAVAPGAVAITGTLFVDPDSFGAFSIVFPPQDVTGTLFVDPDAFGASAVAPGPVTISGVLIADPDGFGASTVAPGAVALSGTIFVDPDSFGAASLTLGALELTASLFVDPDSFGAAGVAAGAVTLTGTAFQDPDSFGGGSMVAGGALVSVTGFPVSVQLDTVLVWGLIDPESTPAWTDIGAPPGPVWTDVTLPTTEDWTDIEP